jgi:hypothetical protein
MLREKFALCNSGLMFGFPASFPSAVENSVGDAARTLIPRIPRPSIFILSQDSLPGNEGIAHGLRLGPHVLER